MKIGSQSCALNSCLTVIDRCLYFYHLDTDDIMYSSVYTVTLIITKSFLISAQASL